MGDSLGTRVKRYEAVSNHKLTPRSPLAIRIDGRAFHTYTRGTDRPFDQALMDRMVDAAVETAREMSGFRLGFVQSDEVSFLLADYENLDTQGWFAYELNKVVSLSASIFTSYFNLNNPKRATFDSRAFTVPVDDAPNVFIWRQQDWGRNSLQMLAGSHFSHKQLHGKKQPDMHQMLHEVGVNWADLTPREKNGTFILSDKTLIHEKADYDRIARWIDPDGDEGDQRVG